MGSASICCSESDEAQKVNAPGYRAINSGNNQTDTSYSTRRLEQNSRVWVSYKKQILFLAALEAERSVVMLC